MSNPLHWGAAQRVSSMSPDESVRSNNSNNFSATAHCLSRRGSFHWARERGITQRWNRNPAIDKAAESTEQDNEIETRTYDCHPCIWLIRCFWRSGFRTTEDEGRDLAVRPRTGGRPHRRGEAETFVLVHARRNVTSEASRPWASISASAAAAAWPGPCWRRLQGRSGVASPAPMSASARMPRSA